MIESHQLTSQHEDHQMVKASAEGGIVGKNDSYTPYQQYPIEKNDFLTLCIFLIQFVELVTGDHTCIFFITIQLDGINTILIHPITCNGFSSCAQATPLKSAKIVFVVPFTT